MDDATYVFCPDGEYIDNAQIHDLTCTGVLAHKEMDDSEDFDQWLENVN